MSGRAAQKCDQGSYNQGDNYETCKPCPYGTTTTAPGAGRTLDDCQAAAGFDDNGMCRIGECNQLSASTASCPVPGGCLLH
jgi:hypothetical protein